jgi:hypothetical protein
MSESKVYDFGRDLRVTVWMHQGRTPPGSMLTKGVEYFGQDDLTRWCDALGVETVRIDRPTTITIGTGTPRTNEAEHVPTPKMLTPPGYLGIASHGPTPEGAAFGMTPPAHWSKPALIPAWDFSLPSYAWDAVKGLQAVPATSTLDDLTKVGAKVAAIGESLQMTRQQLRDEIRRTPERELAMLHEELHNVFRIAEPDATKQHWYYPADGGPPIALETVSRAAHNEALTKADAHLQAVLADGNAAIAKRDAIITEMTAMLHALQPQKAPSSLAANLAMDFGAPGRTGR